RMTQGTRHAMGVGLAEEALRRVVPPGHIVRVQLPLAAGNLSEPEPDVAVVSGQWRDFRDHHPDKALLVVEVSDESLKVDQTTKAGIYALTGVADYWIVNLVENLLEVYRDPVSLGEQPFKFHYRSVQRLTRTDVLTPLALPGTLVKVADLLP
ncbi:MAG TPA: Uma2 family endonuclease, partial [Candidatus Xenobia bacterium]